MTDARPPKRRAVRWVVCLVLVLCGGVVLLRHPQTPVPTHWNPFAPLHISDPVTPVTKIKLRRVLTTKGMCAGVLAQGDADLTPLADVEESAQCHIRDRVALRGLSGAVLSEVETTCATALRLALWVKHGVGPAAQSAYGQGIARLHHLSSYNCRPIRTTAGGATRMSTHATADAIDISGVTLQDGRRIRLVDDWDSARDGAFLRRLRDTSCDWFGTTLGPDYNALHRDHFHLQNRGYGTCR